MKKIYKILSVLLLVLTGAIIPGHALAIDITNLDNGDVKSGVFTIKGNLDNITNIKNVRVKVNNGPWEIAKGTGAWSFVINPRDVLTDSEYRYDPVVDDFVLIYKRGVVYGNVPITVAAFDDSDFKIVEEPLNITIIPEAPTTNTLTLPYIHTGDVLLTFEAAPEVVIKYTTSGGDPSVVYATPIPLTESKVVKAVAIGGNNVPSEVVTFDIEIDPTKGPDFTIQYYADAELTQSLGDNPYLTGTPTGTVYYLKVTPTEALTFPPAPTISIDANANGDTLDINDVPSTGLTFVSGNTFRFARTIISDPSADGSTREVIKLGGIDSDGNTNVAAPVQPVNWSSKAAFPDTNPPVTGTMAIAGVASSTYDSTPSIAFTSVTGANFMQFALSATMPDPSDPAWSSWVDYQDTYDEFDISPGGPGPKNVWAQFMDFAGNQSSPIADNINFNDTDPSFDVQYYIDPDLTNSLGKNPYLAAGTYYIKITANKDLLTAPIISIDANADADLADANDVNGVVTEKVGTDPTRIFRYKRVITPDSINKGTVKEDITLSSLDPSNEATGAAYIDTVAPVITTPPSKITWTNTTANLAPPVTEDSGQLMYKWETVKGTGKVIFGDSEGASTTVEGGAGEQFTVTLRFTTCDAAGYAASSSFDFEWDKKNPTGYVTINGEDDYAASLIVNLSIDGFDVGGSLLDQIALSEDSGFLPAPTWETFAFTKPWTFTAGEGERFIYLKLKDKAGNESQAFSDSIIMDTVVPAAVTSLQAALTATPGEIKLTWTNPPPAEFAGVLIVGSASSSWTPTPGEDYTEGFVLAQNLEILYKGTAETYTHTGLAEDGSTHYYRVFTYDVALNYSTVATANAALADEIPPSEVKYFSAAFFTSGQVDLSWSKPTDSDWAGVEIRRDSLGYPATPSDGTQVYKGDLQAAADTGLVTDGSKTYYYAAFSYDAVATPNYSSGVRTIITPASGDIVAPGPITNFTATPGDGHIALSWTNPTIDFEGVVIRRDIGSYPISQWSGELVYNGAGTGVDDTGLINGTDYYYAAFTYDEVPNFSTPGTQLKAAPQDTDPPTVVTVYPADGATAVAFDTDVRVKFSEPMDETTINSTNFTLSDDTSTAVTGSVAYNALNLTTIFTPDSDLDYNIEYTVTVSAQVKDVAGNALGTNKVWSFTTRSKGYWDTMIWDADEWN